VKERITRATTYKLQPALPKYLHELDQEASRDFDPVLVHLIKLRASQLNGCGFCQNMHSIDARKAGEQQQRLDVLPAWREMPFFSERERAALLWTETLTRLPLTADNEAAWQTVSAVFDPTEIINLTTIISVINAWNRVATGLNFLPSASN